MKLFFIICKVHVGGKLTFILKQLIKSCVEYISINTKLHTGDRNYIFFLSCPNLSLTLWFKNTDKIC